MYSEYQASGQTVQRWCEENNLSTKTFYYWLRKLREAAIKQEQHEIVPVPLMTWCTT
ncbi:MAG: IS66 family insertion sequence element accessory protein TnpA [Oscillospiraceae bacterium]